MTPLLSRSLWLLPLLALLLAGPATAAGERHTVRRVYDGDTLEVAGLGKVRLLGIDTPEREDSARDDFLLRRGLQRGRLRQIDRQATEFTRRQTQGHQLRFEFDRPRRDRHGRILAYVYLPDGRLLNRLLLEAGLAVVYRRFDFTLKQDFLAAEERARHKRAGLWQP